MRSCIACRTKTTKRELLRIVAEPNGSIAFDVGSMLSGRGAYLCPACAGSADNVKKGRLEHTLRTKIADAQWEEVVADLKARANTDSLINERRHNPNRRYAPERAVHDEGCL